MKCLKVLLAAVFLFSGVTFADTNYRKPLPKEILAQSEARVTSMLLEAMVLSRQIGEIRNAMETPCAKVWTRTNVHKGQIWYDIVVDRTGCEEVRPSKKDQKD